MAPLIQWALQVLLGFTRPKINDHLIEIQPQITHHANGQLAIPPSVPNVAAVSWGPNRLDVYAGPTHYDYRCIGHKWWDGAAWGPSPDYFDDIHGYSSIPPVAVSWGPDRNDVFIVSEGDSQVYHFHVTSQSKSESWTALGGSFPSKYPLTAVACNVDRLDVFGIRDESEGNKTLWRKSWDGSSWQPGGQEFEHIEGNFFSTPSVISRSLNEVSLFIVDDQRKLWDRYWDGSQWGPWHMIGENFASAPTAVSLNRDRLDVFCVGLDGHLYHRVWLSKKGWYGWENFGGSFTGSVSIAKLGKTTFHVVGRQTDNLYYYKYLDNSWHPPGKDWNLRGNTAFVTDPTVVSWGDDRFDIFGVTPDMYIARQSFKAGSWYPTINTTESITPSL